jgi:hypothetical protein
VDRVERHGREWAAILPVRARHLRLPRRARCTMKRQRWRTSPPTHSSRASCRSRCRHGCPKLGWADSLDHRQGASRPPRRGSAGREDATGMGPVGDCERLCVGDLRRRSRVTVAEWSGVPIVVTRATEALAAGIADALAGRHRMGGCAGGRSGHARCHGSVSDTHAVDSHVTLARLDGTATGENQVERRHGRQTSLDGSMTRPAGSRRVHLGRTG